MNILILFNYIVVVLWIAYVLRAIVRWFMKPKNKKVVLCSSCGSQISEDAVFCIKCGCSLKQDGVIIQQTNKKKSKISPLSIICGVLLLCAIIHVIVNICIDQYNNGKATEAVETLFEAAQNKDEVGFAQCFPTDIAGEARIYYTRELFIGAEWADLSILKVEGYGFDEEAFNKEYNVNATDAKSVYCEIIHSNEKTYIEVKTIKIDGKWYVWYGQYEFD